MSSMSSSMMTEDDSEDVSQLNASTTNFVDISLMYKGKETKVPLHKAFSFDQLSHYVAMQLDIPYEALVLKQRCSGRVFDSSLVVGDALAADHIDDDNTNATFDVIRNDQDSDSLSSSVAESVGLDKSRELLDMALESTKASFDATIAKQHSSSPPPSSERQAADTDDDNKETLTSTISRLPEDVVSSAVAPSSSDNGRSLQENKDQPEEQQEEAVMTPDQKMEQNASVPPVTAATATTTAVEETRDTASSRKVQQLPSRLDIAEDVTEQNDEEQRGQQTRKQETQEEEEPSPFQPKPKLPHSPIRRVPAPFPSSSSNLTRNSPPSSATKPIHTSPRRSSSHSNQREDSSYLRSPLSMDHSVDLSRDQSMFSQESTFTSPSSHASPLRSSSREPYMHPQHRLDESQSSPMPRGDAFDNNHIAHTQPQHHKFQQQQQQQETWRVYNLELQNKELHERLQRLREQERATFHTLNEDVTQQQQQHQSQQRYIENLEIRLRTSQEEIKLYKQTLTRQQLHTKVLEQENRAFRDEMEQLRDENQDAVYASDRRAAQRWEAELHSLQTQLESANEKVAQLQQETEKYSHELTRKTRVLINCEEHIKNLTLQLQDSQREQRETIANVEQRCRMAEERATMSEKDARRVRDELYAMRDEVYVLRNTLKVTQRSAMSSAPQSFERNGRSNMPPPPLSSSSSPAKHMYSGSPHRSMAAPRSYVEASRKTSSPPRRREHPHNDMATTYTAEFTEKGSVEGDGTARKSLFMESEDSTLKSYFTQPPETFENRVRDLHHTEWVKDDNRRAMRQQQQQQQRLQDRLGKENKQTAASSSSSSGPVGIQFAANEPLGDTQVAPSSSTIPSRWTEDAATDPLQPPFATDLPWPQQDKHAFLENELMRFNMERSRIVDELDRFGSSSGRTIEQRKHKKYMVRRMADLNKRIADIKQALRKDRLLK